MIASVWIQQNHWVTLLPLLNYRHNLTNTTSTVSAIIHHWSSLSRRQSWVQLGSSNLSPVFWLLDTPCTLCLKECGIVKCVKLRKIMFCSSLRYPVTCFTLKTTTSDDFGLFSMSSKQSRRTEWLLHALKYYKKVNELLLHNMNLAKCITI